jgi:transposase
MALYCGIDLHSSKSWIAILDKELRGELETSVGNDLERVLRALAPYREELEGIAVESTWNWYWLVDGLMAAGYRVHLTNTWAAQQWDGLKYTDDRHDARWLAHLLALGILPEGYIYPKQERSVRDLLRRRAFLVRKRTSCLLSMRGSFECRTGMRTSANELKRWTKEDVERYIDDPVAALGITSLLEPVTALTVQIKAIESEALRLARLRDEFAPLLTVWGIGKVLALTIMYEVGDIARFRNVGNFTSYCRLVKTARLSVGKRKGAGNRRNGNPYLSWSFSEAAHHANRHHEQARKYVHRKRSKTNGIVAIRALAHKLARASYHVMRDQVDFDPVRVFGA